MTGTARLMTGAAAAFLTAAGVWSSAPVAAAWPADICREYYPEGGRTEVEFQRCLQINDRPLPPKTVCGPPIFANVNNCHYEPR